MGVGKGVRSPRTYGSQPAPPRSGSPRPTPPAGRPMSGTAPRVARPPMSACPGPVGTVPDRTSRHSGTTAQVISVVPRMTTRRRRRRPRRRALASARGPGRQCGVATLPAASIPGTTRGRRAGSTPPHRRRPDPNRRVETGHGVMAVTVSTTPRPEGGVGHGLRQASSGGVGGLGGAHRRNPTSSPLSAGGRRPSCRPYVRRGGGTARTPVAVDAHSDGTMAASPPPGRRARDHTWRTHPRHPAPRDPRRRARDGPAQAPEVVGTRAAASTVPSPSTASALTDVDRCRTPRWPRSRGPLPQLAPESRSNSAISGPTAVRLQRSNRRSRRRARRPTRRRTGRRRCPDDAAWWWPTSRCP